MTSRAPCEDRRPSLTTSAPARLTLRPPPAQQPLRQAEHKVRKFDPRDGSCSSPPRTARTLAARAATETHGRAVTRAVTRREHQRRSGLDGIRGDREPTPSRHWGVAHRPAGHWQGGLAAGRVSRLPVARHWARSAATAAPSGPSPPPARAVRPLGALEERPTRALGRRRWWRSRGRPASIERSC
jgi:hypothetical protein